MQKTSLENIYVTQIILTSSVRNEPAPKHYELKLALFEPELKLTFKKITVPNRTEALLKTNPNYYLITILDRIVDIYCQFKNVITQLYIFINSILS